MEKRKANDNVYVTFLWHTFRVFSFLDICFLAKGRGVCTNNELCLICCRNKRHLLRCNHILMRFFWAKSKCYIICIAYFEALLNTGIISYNLLILLRFSYKSFKNNHEWNYQIILRTLIGIVYKSLITKNKIIPNFLKVSLFLIYCLNKGY